MADLASQHGDLTTVVRIMRDQVHQEPRNIRPEAFDAPVILSAMTGFGFLIPSLSLSLLSKQTASKGRLIIAGRFNAGSA